MNAWEPRAVGLLWVNSGQAPGVVSLDQNCPSVAQHTRYLSLTVILECRYTRWTLESRREESDPTDQLKIPHSWVPHTQGKSNTSVVTSVSLTLPPGSCLSPYCSSVSQPTPRWVVTGMCHQEAQRFACGLGWSILKRVSFRPYIYINAWVDSCASQPPFLERKAWPKSDSALWEPRPVVGIVFCSEVNEHPFTLQSCWEA